MLKNVFHIWCKRQIVLLLSVWMSCTAFAYDFEVDGLWYDFLSDNQVKVIGLVDYSYIGALIIPETVIYNDIEYRVTLIKEFAFYGCSGLTGSLIIPKSVTSIGESAFDGCRGFTGSLTIPNSVTSIGKGAFYGCSGFTGSLTIPNSVTSIGERAFYGCSGFTGSLTIPNSVTSIGGHAFYGCSGFTGSLTISNSVTSIGGLTFRSCSGLTGSLIIPKSVTSIGESAFDGCRGFTGSLTIPNSVTSIGKRAFYGCSGFTGSLTIPNSVTSIREHAFYGCSGLTGSLIIPNSVTSIREHAFWGCSGFTGSLTIPNSVTSIGTYAFSSCSGLTSLIISNSVTSIGGSAFMRCSGLEHVYSNILTPFSIGISTFSDISTNSVLHIPKNTKSLYEQYSEWTSYFSNIIEDLENPNITYSLSIKATGNGSASYNGETIRGKTKTYTVNEGTSVTITFTPDNGYRIKSMKVNGSSVTVNTSYKTTINADTSIEVVFEEIPPTTYTLSVKATGNGSASYNGETIRDKTKTYTVNEGTSVTISFTPDTGYRIKSLKVNGSSVTATSSYTTTINADTSIEVVFEEIPPTTYTLSIKATGNGSASYGGESIRGTTKSYTVNEGTSVTISFAPDNGYRIKSLKVNGSSVTANTSYKTTINADTSIEVVFEEIPATTYTLSIKATGNGSASYGGETIRGQTKTYTVNEGTSVTVSFTPDNGNRIKSLKVNGTSVTASSSYNTTINADTSIEVVFEEIPATTYTLSIKATGNGSASYSGETIRSQTKTYTVNEGTSVTITFTPDNGYRIKSLKVNGSSVTASTSYKTTINEDTSIEVVFEEISATTYTLSIKATGNGSASYSGETIRGKTKTYTVNEGTSVTITFTPDNGYRIKSLKVNGASVTVSTSYKTTINADTSIEVEFEDIPVTTYSLSIKAVGNGSATYKNTTVRDDSQTFTVNEGSDVTIAFTPDDGYRIKSVKHDEADVTPNMIDNSYTISDIHADATVEVEFEERVNSFSADGISYQVTSWEGHTLTVVAAEDGLVIEIPDKISSQDEEWTVTGIDGNVLDGHEILAAVIWNPEAPFTARVSNPNLLLYVKDEQYAPATIKNVVVNGYANSITLTDAQSGNNFYCPEAFTAQSISYTHNYLMKTGLHESRGWETIALPFDVQKVSHSSKGEIVPYARWTSGSSVKPFWLYELSESGFVEAEGISSNTPYIISMPNNEAYPNEYHLTGRISFSSENVTVERSSELQVSTFSDRSFTPNFICRDANAGYYALNVSNDYEYYQGSENEGSRFILNLRQIHPFEAYMTSSANTRSIGIFDDMTTDIRGIEILANEETIKVYDLSGKLLRIGTSLEDMKQGLPAGVYIVNHQKIMIK